MRKSTEEQGEGLWGGEVGGDGYQCSVQQSPEELRREESLAVDSTGSQMSTATRGTFKREVRCL